MIIKNSLRDFEENCEIMVIVWNNYRFYKSKEVKKKIKKDGLKKSLNFFGFLFIV